MFARTYILRDSPGIRFKYLTVSLSLSLSLSLSVRLCVSTTQAVQTKVFESNLTDTSIDSQSATSRSGDLRGEFGGGGVTPGGSSAEATDTRSPYTR